MKKFLILTLLAGWFVLPLAAWVPVTGDWQLQNNNRAAEWSDGAAPGNRPLVALAESGKLRNGRIAVRVSTRDGVGDVYLIGRWRNADNFYALRYRDPLARLELIKVADGRETVLASKENCVAVSPKSEALTLTLEFRGDRFIGRAGRTVLEGAAGEFSNGASGIGVRNRQAEFSDWTMERYDEPASSNWRAEWSAKRMFNAGETGELTLHFTNLTQRKLGNLEISAQVAGEKLRKSFTFENVASGDSVVCIVPLAAHALKPGDYQLRWQAREDGRFFGAGDLDFTVLARRNADRFEVMLWDKINDWNELHRLGFTAAGTQFYFTSRFAQEGKGYADRIADYLREAEEGRKYGIDGILKIDSRRFWDWKRFGAIRMVGADGKPQLKGEVCFNHPEYRKHLAESVEALGKRLQGNPVIRHILFDSESENEERKLYPCFHPECVAKAEQAGFAPALSGVNRVWGMVGASLYANPARAGVEHGVVPDDQPDARLIRWWWNDGSGAVDARGEAAKQMRRYLPSAKSFHDPILRTPPMRGRDRGMDYVGQWTYTNASPLGVLENVDEMLAAVNGTKPVVPDIQLFWYTNEVAESPSDAAERKKLATESANFVEARDAVHTGRFMTISPDHLTEAVWLAMARPIAALMFDGGSAISTTPGTYAYTNPDTVEALARVNAELVRPYGPMLARMTKTPRRVGMIQSAASTLFGRTGNYGNANKGFADFYISAVLAQLQPVIVWDEDAANLNDFEVLLIGDTRYLPQSMAEAVRKFAASGKTVIYDRMLTAEIPGAKPIDIVSTDKMGALKQQQTYVANAARLRRMLDEAGFRSAIRSSDDELVIATRGDGAAQVIFLINDARVAGQYVGQFGKVLENLRPRRIRVRFAPELLADGRVLYDCLAGREVRPDANGEAEFFLKEGKLLYLAPRRIEGIRVTPEPRAVTRGQSVRLQIELLPQMAGTQAYSLEIRDAAGKIVPASGDYRMVDGKAEVTVETAGNDEPGFWHVRATDRIAGFAGENTIEVR